MPKSIVTFLGIVLVIMGVVGFFQDPLFGLFDVSLPLSLFHLLTGVFALAFSAIGNRAARQFSWVFFALYLLLSLAGFFSSTGIVFDLFRVNLADNYIHLILALLFLASGLSPVYGYTSYPAADNRHIRTETRIHRVART